MITRALLAMLRIVVSIHRVDYFIKYWKFKLNIFLVHGIHV